MATIKASKVYVYICEDCGREFQDKTPFPVSCTCGNFNEDFFRLKDLYDFQDDKAGRPLLGVRYDPEVLKERNERLAKINNESSGTITQPTIEDGKPIEISFDSLNKKQLRDYLKEKGSPLADKVAKKEELIEECKKLTETDSLW